MPQKAPRPGTLSGETASGTSRLEAFSDGVFSIAITLLVLNIKVPEIGTIRSGAHLARVLTAQWPIYLGYFMSFFVIGITWIDHHVLFNYIQRPNRTLLILNLLLLLTVAFVPFPTAVLSNSLQQRIGENTAALLYSGTLFLMGVWFNALWGYASRTPGLLDPTADARQVRKLTRRSLIWPSLYLISMIAAPFNVTVSLVIYVLVPLTFFLPNATDRF